MKRLRIIFMGTPDFAVPSLEALHKNGYDPMLVISQPDRPKGRGRKLAPPPVKEKALEFNYKIIQPEKIKSQDFIQQIKVLEPDLIIVAAYGKILSQELLDAPKFGAINVHPSLLPKYRGPAPIQWAVLNGDTVTGVTIMQMDKGMDSGDILLARDYPILPDDTAGTLHDRLAVKGAELLIEATKKLQKGTLKALRQDHNMATLAPMLKKKDGQIDWKKDAVSVNNWVRGMTPWPGSFIFIDKKLIKIFKGQARPLNADKAPATVLQGFPDELVVACGLGAFSILELQGESGKRLNIKDFLRGNPIEPGTVLT